MEPLTELAGWWRADGFRYTGRTDARALLKAFLTIPGFQYTAVMRACRVLLHGRGRAAKVAGLLVLRRFERRWGISIPMETDIGPGLYIGHFGGIVVNPRARIGRNCNLSRGVTIGETFRGRRAGTPTIGDGVWIGPGARLVGAITVGDNAAIGPNCVVAQDVPANAVLAAPAPVLLSATRGAEGYMSHTVAPDVDPAGPRAGAGPTAAPRPRDR